MSSNIVVEMVINEVDSVCIAVAYTHPYARLPLSRFLHLKHMGLHFANSDHKLLKIHP